MRVAFDYQIFSLQAYGGISRYFTRLVEHLAAAKEEVKIFSPVHCNEYLDSLTPALRYGRRISRKSSKAIRLALPYNHIVCRHKISNWKPDLVHETYFSMFNSKPALVPVVVSVFDMVHELFPKEFSKVNRYCDFKRKAVERADHVICISENTRNDLLNTFHIHAEKVSVAHLGFDSFPDNQPAARADVLSTNRPFLLFVGNRKGYKNFSGLLRAVSLSPQLRSTFDIVAFGGGAFTNTEQALIKSLGYDARQVYQTGSTDAELAVLYDKAVALIYPSLYEGFGLPPLEAMAHNCPVIVSRAASMPEVVGDAGEYFEPSSPESIAAAIVNVVFSTEKTSSLVRKGQKRLGQFSWETCASKTLAIYEKLLS